MEEKQTPLAHGFDVAAIRAAAANLDDGAVTAGYQADREAVIHMLNDALATELVCVMRYKRHYYTVSGRATAAKAEFPSRHQGRTTPTGWPSASSS
jgi:bacterioferritin